MYDKKIFFQMLKMSNEIFKFVWAFLWWSDYQTNQYQTWIFFWKKLIDTSLRVNLCFAAKQLLCHLSHAQVAESVVLSRHLQLLAQVSLHHQLS